MVELLAYQELYTVDRQVWVWAPIKAPLFPCFTFIAQYSGYTLFPGTDFSVVNNGLLNRNASIGKSL